MKIWPWAHLKALRMEVDGLRALLADQLDPEVTGINLHNGFLNVGIRGGIAQVVAASFAEQFREHRKHGAMNYIEIHLLEHKDAEIGPLIVTIQRKHGKTPDTFRREAEARADAAERALRDMGAE